MGTYGRMTKPVVNTLLAKMYLNAEVYTGTPMYDQAVSYANKVIHEGGFGLEKNYRNLFCGENHLSPLHGNEIIFAIPCDGENAKAMETALWSQRQPTVVCLIPNGWVWTPHGLV